MTDAGDDMIGQSIGTYKIDRLIGQGSMGMVYHGIETSKQVEVAIKTMNQDGVEDDELLQRFQREARVANEIRHPNVAHVYESGDFRAAPYLVMEYIDGPTLAEMVKAKGPVPFARAVGFMKQAAEGLKAATSHGCLHRDIKPQNLMVNSKGQIKIVDFGIAKNDGGDSLKTAVGVVLGSPYYMSPEQSAAQKIDHRSDMYGLGATFYYILTGRPPFEGRNLVEVIQKRARNDLRPITQINPDVPKRVCDLVYKMMSPDPKDRYQDYDKLVKAMDEALTARASAPEPTPQPVAAAASSSSDSAKPSGSWMDLLEDDRVRVGLFVAGGAILVIAIGLLIFG